MQVARALNCCGILEIEGVRDIHPQNLITEIGKKYESYSKAASNLGMGLETVVIIRDDLESYERVLLDAGFRLVTMFNNPRTMNDCFVYHKVLNNPITKEAKKRAG